jgi:DNA (cytosine-5)-methyltransferase 1
MMTIGSLFSGIGGLELGLEWAGLGKTVWQVEKDEYCRRVLAKHWPNAERYEDVKEVGKHNLRAVDIVCGGFPCQDISRAGKQQGLSGERSGLWFEMHRIISELRPYIAIMENVPNLISGERGKWFGSVLWSLAEIGYDAEWQCIPAGRLGAHFFGERVYVMASPSEAGFLRRQGRWTVKVEADTWGWNEFERLVRVEVQHGVPAGTHGRISDGVSHRMDRLRALGNAVVPQVAQAIGGNIKERINVTTKDSRHVGSHDTRLP